MDLSTAFPRLNDSQISMIEAMNEHSRERNKGYQIHILKRFFDVRRVRYPVTLGSFSWSSMAIRQKWLHSNHAINFGGGFVTPGDLARDYLAIKYADRRIKCTTDQWRNCVVDKRRVPNFCMPMRIQNASYLDLSGAFWQIVRSAGWDVNYNPGKFIYSQSRMIDFPYYKHKLARNCLVSVGIPAPVKMWNGNGQLVYIKRKSRFVNLILLRLVHDVLNCVAKDMIEFCGAVYVNCDGYIIPTENLAAGFDVLNDWGLEGRIKATGEVDIVSMNCYAFNDPVEGFKATENYRRRPNRMKHAINNVYDDNRDWLRDRFSKLARFAQSEWDWIDS